MPDGSPDARSLDTGRSPGAGVSSGAGSLDAVLSGRTVVVLTHRLADARRADRIAVLECGRIVELGPHAELMAAGGSCARLVLAAEGRPL